jgi:hypothetical protein
MKTQISFFLLGCGVGAVAVLLAYWVFHRS